MTVHGNITGNITDINVTGNITNVKRQDTYRLCADLARHVLGAVERVTEPRPVRCSVKQVESSSLGRLRGQLVADPRHVVGQLPRLEHLLRGHVAEILHADVTEGDNTGVTITIILFRTTANLHGSVHDKELGLQNKVS